VSLPAGNADAPLVAVYCSSRIEAGDPRYARAQELGASLSRAGLRVATGGNTGLMEAISRGVTEAGGRPLGLTISGWDGLAANRWVGLQVDSSDLFERLRRFSQVDLAIAIDGGVGTLLEASLAWNMLQIGPGGRPLLLVGDHWSELLELLRRRFVVSDADLALLRLLPGEPAPEAIVAAAREALAAPRSDAAGWR